VNVETGREEANHRTGSEVFGLAMLSNGLLGVLTGNGQFTMLDPETLNKRGATKATFPTTNNRLRFAEVAPLQLAVSDYNAGKVHFASIIDEGDDDETTRWTKFRVEGTTSTSVPEPVWLCPISDDELIVAGNSGVFTLTRHVETGWEPAQLVLGTGDVPGMKNVLFRDMRLLPGRSREIVMVANGPAALHVALPERGSKGPAKVLGVKHPIPMDPALHSHMYGVAHLQNSNSIVVPSCETGAVAIVALSTLFPESWPSDEVGRQSARWMSSQLPQPLITLDNLSGVRGVTALDDGRSIVYTCGNTVARVDVADLSNVVKVSMDAAAWTALPLTDGRLLVIGAGKVWQVDPMSLAVLGSATIHDGGEIRGCEYAPGELALASYSHNAVIFFKVSPPGGPFELTETQRVGVPGVVYATAESDQYIVATGNNGMHILTRSEGGPWGVHHPHLDPNCNAGSLFRETAFVGPKMVVMGANGGVVSLIQLPDAQDRAQAPVVTTVTKTPGETSIKDWIYGVALLPAFEAVAITDCSSARIVITSLLSVFPDRTDLFHEPPSADAPAKGAAATPTDEEAAAVTIQAGFRAHRSRQAKAASATAAPAADSPSPSRSKADDGYAVMMAPEA